MLSSAVHHRPKLQLICQVSFRFFSCSNHFSSSSSSSSSSLSPSPSPSASPSSNQGFWHSVFTLSPATQQEESSAQKKSETDPSRSTRRRQPSSSREQVLINGLQNLSSLQGSCNGELHGNDFVVSSQREKCKGSLDGIGPTHRRLDRELVKDGVNVVSNTIIGDGERKEGERIMNALEEMKNVVEEIEPARMPPQQCVVVRGRPRRRTQIDALSELQQKVQLLQSEQASATEVSILLKKKAFKSASPEQLLAVLKVLKEFCPSGEKACLVLVKNSGVIWQPIDLLRRRLKVLSDFEVGEEALLRLATSIYMLTVQVEKLQETLEFLKGIGLSVESINKIICKNPKTLRLSIQSSMQPTVDFLQSTGMKNEKILKLLERRPELFAMSIDDNLMVKYKFFQQLGLSAQKFSTALRSMTQYSNDTILARLDAIKEHGFSDADVLEMVRKQPNILANSSETIKNKLNYLLHQQNRPTMEVVRFPACLGYSLEERIIPRFKFLEENNLSKPYSLSTILATKQSDFVEKCKVLDSLKIL